MLKQPLPESWWPYLGGEFEKPYMQQLRGFLKQEKDQHKVIFPHSSHWFNAFQLTPLDQVRVVILGQDPYHGPGQAHGLCFSVRAGVAIPPSLRNIYQELQQDVGFQPPAHGCLTHWARQGVLLLNSVLTVEQGQAASHQKQGWETFTDKAIEVVNQHAPTCVFLLWGSHAQRKASFVDTRRHCVLKSPHPSPLSAHRGFFGQHHFSQANAFLQQQGRDVIDWQLPMTPPPDCQ